jgi:transcriptional regulator with XRE-family HTH domain
MSFGCVSPDKWGTMSVFGGWLKNQRDRRGWTQEQLGELVDLSKAQISRLESGSQGTKPATIVRIANALGASVDDAVNALMADKIGLKQKTVDPDVMALIEEYQSLTPASRDTARTLVSKLRENQCEYGDTPLSSGFRDKETEDRFKEIGEDHRELTKELLESEVPDKALAN